MQNRIENTLLYNADAEVGVVSGILFNNDNYRFATELSGKHFGDHELGKIFDACRSVLNSGKLADETSVYYELKSEKWVIDKIVEMTGADGGARYQIESACNEVRNCHARRTIRKNMLHIAEKCQHEVDPVILLSFVNDAATSALQSISEKEPRLIGDIMADVWDMISSERPAVEHLKTGINAIDNMTGGYPFAAMAIVAARPSVGKTMYGGNLLANWSLAGKTGVMFTLEDKDIVVTSRILAREAQINIGRITHGHVKKHEHGAILDAMSAHSKSNIYVEDMSGMSVSKMRSKATRIKNKHGKLDFIIVDHLAHIPIIGSKYEGVSRNSFELACTVKDLGCAGPILHQLKRGAEKRDDPRPALEDLKDSGDIEQHARAVHMLFAPIDYDQNADPNGYELIVRKASMGPVGTIELYRDKKTMTISDKGDVVNEY